jgi:glycosyltransferase involved in cell wall biosynthesis
VDNQNTSKILVDCERMKYPYTGLYYYCYYLGKFLLQENKGKRNIGFYLPPAVQTIFGENSMNEKQHPLDKYVLCLKNKWDLWHSTYQSSNYYPKNKKTKVVLTVHDVNFMYDTGKSDKKKQRYLDKVRKRIDRADHIVAISKFTLHDVGRFINITGKPASVIYNGNTLIELDTLNEPKLKPAAPFIFTIGTIIRKKNFHVLPALLLNNDLQLVIAGITQSEAYKQSIIDEAKKLGVSNRVVFTGPVSENDKQWYLKNCTAFTFPSISEGFGLPVVEAMHFGKPLLLSNSTSLPEIGGPHAAYFENFDPHDMNRIAMKAINEHNDEKAVLLKKHAESFNWKTSAQQYLDVYDQVLAY